MHLAVVVDDGAVAARHAASPAPPRDALARAPRRAVGDVVPDVAAGRRPPAVSTAASTVGSSSSSVTSVGGAPAAAASAASVSSRASADAAVRVPHAGRDLDQLAGVPDQHDPLHARRRRSGRAGRRRSWSTARSASRRRRSARAPRARRSVPGARYTVSCPSASAMSTCGSSERSQASSDLGITRPEVPRIESPPSMPSRALKVRRAVSSPPGTLDGHAQRARPAGPRARRRRSSRAGRG